MSHSFKSIIMDNETNKSMLFEAVNLYCQTKNYKQACISCYQSRRQLEDCLVHEEGNRFNRLKFRSTNVEFITKDLDFYLKLIDKCLLIVNQV